jgi:CHAT domain-containing protein
MGIKRSLFEQKIKLLLRQVRATVQRHISIIILAVLFLVTAILPSTAHMVTGNLLAQASLNAENLVEQGKALYEAEKFNDAVKILQQAAAAFAGSGDKLGQAMTLSNLSLAYQQLGLWKEAEGAIAQSLNLLQHLERSQERAGILAQTLDVQGRLHLTRGQTENALNSWQQAADIYKKLGDRVKLVRNHINCAQALQVLGFYNRAENILDEVKQTLQNIPDASVRVEGFRSLGDVLRLLGKLRESEEILKESLKVAESLRSNQVISEVLVSLGKTARAQKNPQAALNFFQQAAALSPPINTRIELLLNRFSLLLETQQFRAATDLLPQTQSEINKLPPSRMAVYARINLAQNLARLKKEIKNHSNKNINTPSWLDIAQLLAPAVQQAKSLQDKRAESYATGTLGSLYEQTEQLSHAFDLTEKALFTAQAIDAPDITYQWQWQLGRLLKQKGDIKGAIAAYQVAFRTLQSLRSDLVAINPDIQFSFTESVEPVYRELVDLQLQSKGNLETTSQNLTQARDVIESLKLAELNNFFRSACLEPIVKLDEVLSQDENAAVIYPIILPDRLEVILTLPGQNKLRQYTTKIPRDQVESIITSLRSSLLDVAGTSQVKEQSQKIYEWLIRPAEVELTNSGIKTLAFVLDGSLRNIPMAVLYDRQQQKYLVEKYAIALTPGLQLVNPKPLQRVELNALTAGVGKERFGLPPLQNVARELKVIQSKVSRSKELLNQEFTQTNLQKQLQSTPFSVVHLATHGEFSSDPEKTFILTWDKLLKVKEFDKLVRTSETNRSSNIELLVLSACKTAQGDKRAALGLAGVAVQAGARSTLASLWSVDDQSTAFLMSEFYRQLKTGVTKAEALQHAQLAVVAKENSPYYWAPYVLLGNWL